MGKRRNQKGFTLFEVILAIFIILIAIVPLLDAYRPSLLSGLSEEAEMVCTNQVRGTLNRAGTLAFSTLWNNQGSPSLDTLFGSGQGSVESFSLNGTTSLPGITITDASGGAGGLIEIAVTVNQVTLKTLKADY